MTCSDKPTKKEMNKGTHLASHTEWISVLPSADNPALLFFFQIFWLLNNQEDQGQMQNLLPLNRSPQASD